jgi:hypothetical protein
MAGTLVSASERFVDVFLANDGSEKYSVADNVVLELSKRHINNPM